MSTLRPSRRSERGMVTAELAAATLAALAVVTLMCWGISLVVTQLRCVDAAAAMARQAARGDGAALSRAQASLPAGATARVLRAGGVVTVSVRVDARPLARWMVVVPLQATAQVLAEPGSR